MALAITIPATLLLLYGYVMWISRKCTYALPFTIVFLIEIIWGTISIVWIDHGVYISEQLRYSHFTGAALRYIILIAPFAIIFPWLTNKLIKKDVSNPKKITSFKLGNPSRTNQMIWIVGLACVIYLLTDIAVSGSPLLHNEITKGNFYSLYSKFPLTETIHNYIIPVFSIFCGFNYAKKSRKGKSVNKYLLVFLAIILYQVLLSNKFYGLYDYVVWFLIPVILENIGIFKQKRKIPIKYIALTLVGVSVFLYICYNKYTSTAYIRGGNALQYLLDRIFALQSHTFWGVDYNVQQGTAGLNFDTLFSEIINGFLGVSIINSDFGIAKIMYSVTSSSYADDMISSGFLFSGSFATVALSYSGYVITFIFSILLGYIMANISFALYKYLRNFDVIGLFFVFWIYRRFYEFYRVGTLSMVLSWKMIIIYVFVIGLMLYSRGSKRELQAYNVLERNPLN